MNGTEEAIVNLGRELDSCAEPGYFETRTHDRLSRAFRELGFTVTGFPGMTGFAAVSGNGTPAAGDRAAADKVDAGKAAGATGGGEAVGGAPPGLFARAMGVAKKTPSRRPILLIADMDGLPDPGAAGTGTLPGKYIHSCGHHMQMTALYGAARILLEKRSPALDLIEFCAVPAEEFIDHDRRRSLIDQGKVRFLSGKQELIGRGYIQPFRYVIATHAAAAPPSSEAGGIRGAAAGTPPDAASGTPPDAASGTPPGAFFNSVVAMNGFDHVSFTFTGRASHAGAHPHKGKNAQNCASLFLQACAFLRETFDEADHVRIHPILRLPPDQSVNLIPEKAFVETYVRGVTADAVRGTTDKLAAAARGCGTALGIDVNVTVTPGYRPFHVDPALHGLVRSTAEEMGLRFVQEDFSAASSDMGDISELVPSVIIGLPGSNGMFHNRGFSVIDETAGYLLSSRFTARYLEKLAAAMTEGGAAI